MRYLLTVPALTPGSGLSKYVMTLASMLINLGNEVGVLATHTSDFSYERESLNKIGVKYHFYNTSKYKICKYLKFIHIIRSFNADVIINNYDGLIQYILPFCKNKSRLIHILHNDTPDFYRIGSINGRFVDGWIAPTKAVADNFNVYTKYKYVQQVSVIPHGVEETNFDLSVKDQKTLTFVGVLEEHKGVLLLPQIIKELENRQIDFNFTIVGGGK